VDPKDETTMTTTEEKYRAILAEQEEEGLSREEAAARAGVKPNTLSWWRCELKRRDRDGVHRRRGQGKSDVGPPELLPVRVQDVVARATFLGSMGPTPYEVVLGSGRVVRVPRDFDDRSVQSLVRLLEELPC
jgi:hypothetical protein